MNADICKTLIARNCHYYNANSEEYCRLTQSANMTSLHARFLSFLPLRADILDAGSGSGRDSAVFRDLGYTVTAIDSSSKMVAATRQRGINAHLVTFQSLDFCDRFDGIWASASLLHIPQCELHDVLTRFRMALRPTGVLFVSLKEGSGERIEADGRFFSYNSAASFHDRACGAGFDVLEETIAAPSIPGGPRWIQVILRSAAMATRSDCIPEGASVAA